jgi:hypothetical protein
MAESVVESVFAAPFHPPPKMLTGFNGVKFKGFFGKVGDLALRE